jgi:hypothetical protein
MAKPAKRKRKPNRASPKEGRIVDLLDIVKDRPPPTPPELRRKQEALGKLLYKKLEPHVPALKQLGRALQGWRGLDLGAGHLLSPAPALMRAAKLLKPRGSAEEPQRAKPAAKRKPKASADKDRARWAILQLYPKGVPDTVSPKILHREVAKKLSEHETANLNLPAPSPRTVQRARNSL